MSLSSSFSPSSCRSPSRGSGAARVKRPRRGRGAARVNRPRRGSGAARAARPRRGRGAARLSSAVKSASPVAHPRQRPGLRLLLADGAPGAADARDLGEHLARALVVQLSAVLAHVVVEELTEPRQGRHEAHVLRLQLLAHAGDVHLALVQVFLVGHVVQRGHKGRDGVRPGQALI